MKTYHVTLVIDDTTSVDASTPEEAEQIAKDIFAGDGYDMSRAYQFETVEAED